MPSCHSCQAWLYDKDWKQSIRGGKPIPRPPNSSPPCWKCPKSTDGKPNPDAELTERGYRMLAMYYRVKAGMPMPADAVAQWYCGIILQTLEMVDRGLSSLAMLAPLLIGTMAPKDEPRGGSRGRSDYRSR